MITGRTLLETAYGKLDVATHGTRDSPERCVSIVLGDISVRGSLIRIHSSCLFGEVLLACDCDCGPQLASALTEISRRGAGAVVYLYQEGRGAGLDVKIQAMERQRIRGIDSYAAYDSLDLPRDLRHYHLAGVAMADLGFARQVTLLSNNPNKVEGLAALGYEVLEQLVVPYTVSERALEYLEMKRSQGKHAVDFSKISFTA